MLEWIARNDLLAMFIATFLVAFCIGFVFACVLAMAGKSNDDHIIGEQQRQLDGYAVIDAANQMTIATLRSDLVGADLANSRLRRVLDMDLDNHGPCPNRDTHSAIVLSLVSDEDKTIEETTHEVMDLARFTGRPVFAEGGA